MENHSQSIPRLRLTRNSTQAASADRRDTSHTTSSSQAGPSRLPDLTQLVDVNLSDLEINSNNDHDHDNDHDQPTPKLSTRPPLGTDTPAARLRALLSRVPQHPASPLPATRIPSPSEFESDFEPPRPGSATPSMARESLKDLFSRALRDPGDTPQKTKRRRNSIDLSEVDFSPRKGIEKNKGKRKSLSDEEVENPSKSIRQLNSSSRHSSQAVTFDMLQSRFSNTQLDSSHRYDDSESSATILRDLNSSNTPPVATSTPQHSLRMSVNSQLQFQSNLLEQDSEMQRAIDAMDSGDGESESFSHPTTGKTLMEKFPSNVRHESNSPRESASSRRSHVKALDLNNSDILPNRSEDVNSQSQHLNSSGTTVFPEATLSANRTTHERGNASETAPLSRKGSFASLRSIDSTSSKGSSFGSQAEYHERIREMENERNSEREREWNRRHPTKLSRPTSSLSVRSSDERPRTQSLNIRTRVDSGPHLSPASSEFFAAGLRRHSSFTSSRGSSPSGSSRASQEEDPVEVEIVHERERNWNAPRPKWHQLPSIHDKNTPRMDSPSLSTASHSPHSSHGHSRLDGRVRADSLGSSRASRGKVSLQDRGSSLHLENRTEQPSKNSSASTSLFRSSHSQSHITIPGRSESPSVPVSKHKGRGSNNVEARSPAAAVAPKKTHIPISPFLLERSNTGLSHSSTEHKSKAAVRMRDSQIPIRLPNKRESPLTQRKAPSVVNNGTLAADSYEDSAIPEETDETDPGSRDRTPTLRTVEPPVESLSHSYSRSPTSRYDEARLQNTFTSNPKSSPLPSPPIEHSEVQPRIHSSPSTPPRLSSSRSTRINFQTPSPPKSLPDLPGPPSSSEEDEKMMQSTPPQGNGHSKLSGGSNLNWTALKTPRPPGSFLSTPLRMDDEIYALESLQTPHNPSGGKDGPQWTAKKTPKPPGAWVTTPAPRNDNTNGLATPVASLSKASTLSAQTPAPPGAWSSTPSAKKSVLKVRFESQNKESPSADDTEVSSVPPVDNNSDTLDQPNSRADSSHDAVSGPDFRTPQSSISRRSLNQRKSPGIRILDAFGRDQEAEILDSEVASKAATSSIRVEDTTRNENEPTEPSPSLNGDSGLSLPYSDIPLGRSEAISRVRQGLDELVHDLSEIDSSHGGQTDHARIEELDHLSRDARDVRERLAMKMLSNEVDLRQKLEPLRESMKKVSVQNGVADGYFLKLPTRKTVVLFLLFQVALYGLMYRVTLMRAKDIFLTTYYDPFYPDLHLYSPGSVLHLATSHTSWLSLPSVIVSEGWKDFSKRFLNNVSAMVGEWQWQLWQTWGYDGMQSPARSWPPT